MYARELNKDLEIVAQHPMVLNKGLETFLLSIPCASDINFPQYSMVLKDFNTLCQYLQQFIKWQSYFK